ncbi:MAG: GxxExxY protein [Saprospiraceae bacterium]
MITKRFVTDLSYKIIGAAIKVHKELGPGLLEKVYEKLLTYELRKSGHKVENQLRVPVFYDNKVINTDLRLDLLVDDLVVVELKTVEHLLPVHQAQLLTYMKLLDKPQGLLINFYSVNISKSYIPLVNEHFKQLP